MCNWIANNKANLSYTVFLVRDRDRPEQALQDEQEPCLLEEQPSKKKKRNEFNFSDKIKTEGKKDSTFVGSHLVETALTLRQPLRLPEDKKHEETNKSLKGWSFS